jgi:DNA-binding CsgD family transcriptional regulator
VSAADEASARAAALAGRFADADLKAFALLTQGLVRASRHQRDASLVSFDEAMVAVTVESVSPITVGIVYCAVLEACYEMADIGRAREWTHTLSEWCAGQPDLVAFRGHCAVHRAETMRFEGAWSDALAEAALVCRRVTSDARGTGSRGVPIGAAYYEIAEIHRMRGEFAEAEQAYRDASQHGRPPEPGLALLRLAQGKHGIAEASIRTVLETPRPPFARASVLAASVEISLARKDLEAARRSADELAGIAAKLPTPFLQASAAQALGAVLLAQADERNALLRLREAWMAWQSLDLPYEAARVRVLMAVACRALGDVDAASMECAAARRVFDRLGAAPELARADQFLGRGASPCLTAREVEVIKLVASGRTNRTIARALGISERTVDRHVSNILAKLDLSSRAAATAYAYEHNLV